MSQKINAIVVKSSDKKEKDLNVLLFSLELGKFWVTLKGVKQPKAKLKSATFQFAFGQFLLEDGKAGKIVTSFDLMESFHEISQDIDKYFEASAIMEVVDKLEFENQNEIAAVFMLALNALKTICFKDVPQNYVLCKFLMQILKLHGINLYNDKCTCCGTSAFAQKYIDFSSGTIVCAACKNFTSQALQPAVFAALKVLTDTDFDKLQTVHLAKQSEMGLLKVLVTVFSYQFDTTLNMIGILK